MQDTIVERQRADHQQLDQLLNQYTAAAAQDEKAEVFLNILHLVTTHAFAEEEVLFPAARRLLASGGELTRVIESEHQRANELLKEMQSLEPGSSEFEARAAELFPLLRSDVRNEEDRLLPALVRALEVRQLQRLGIAWEAAKKAAPNRAHPAVPRRPPGNVLAGIFLYFSDHALEWLRSLRGPSKKAVG